MKVNPRFQVDPYLAKTFSLHDYNCWHFAADVWADLTGVRLHAFLEDFSASALNEVAEYKASTLKKIDALYSPCLVLMQRQRINPHIGVYIGTRVLHMGRQGAFYVPVNNATAGFTTVTYYQ